MSRNTILITGGGSGIGRRLAEEFHKQGNEVVIAGRRRKSLNEVTEENPGIKSVLLDVSDPASIASFAADAAKNFPSLNVLINNAGIMVSENYLEQQLTDPSISEKTIAINLLGPIRLTSALLPLLQKQLAATIMTVSSGLAFVPLAVTPTYGATKAAIHSWTQSLRCQLRSTNLEVIELIPPYVQTTLMSDEQAEDPAAMPLDEFIHEVMAILQAEPGIKEVCVKRVYPLRFAAEQGQVKYDEFVQEFNDRVHK